MNPTFIYITCKDKQQALEIGKSLLQKRLVACINVIDNMISAYWWEGKIVEDHECILIAKSQAQLVDKISHEVTALHSYDVPCVISLPIQNGHEPYLKWIAEEATNQ
ncbi:MAG: divalent-cation tolerance protein CutA [Bacteroidia bacterium]|nr:divalent-cation tolerance protein CutA [Bacteroidia bacterium]